MQLNESTNTLTGTLTDETSFPTLYIKYKEHILLYGKSITEI